MRVAGQKTIYAFMAATVGAVFAAAGNAEMITLAPVADTTLNSQFSGNSAGGHDHVAAGSNGEGLPRRALFRFDLEGQIPAGMQIDSAELQLSIVNGNTNNGSTFDLFQMMVDWNEGAQFGNNGSQAADGDATWANRAHPDTPWGAPGGGAGMDYADTASASTAVAGFGDYLWSGLRDDVQQWYDDPSSNFGWILISQSESSSRSARQFESREAAEDAPILTIQFSEDQTPELDGDVNLDGTVDLNDFNIIKNNFGATNVARIDGDVTGDMNVDLNDFNIVKNNFGNTASVAAPEPCSLLLAVLGALWLIAPRMRRSTSLES